MITSTPVEVRNVSAARVHAAQDLHPIIAVLPPAVERSSIEQLKVLAEHVTEWAERLQPTA